MLKCMLKYTRNVCVRIVNKRLKAFRISPCEGVLG